MKQSSKCSQVAQRELRQQSGLKNDVKAYVQVQWVAVYLDNKYFLTVPSAYQKLQSLDLQIQQEKSKLNNTQRQQVGSKAALENGNHQKPPIESKVRKNSFESLNSRECKTEINELKALRAKVKIEKQLVEEELKHFNKTIEVKKRRELKDSTTFVIKSQKDNKLQDSQRKSKKESTKNFMMAPHELASNRKSSQKQEERTPEVKIKTKMDQKQKTESVSIKYRTIEVKSRRNDEGSLLEGGNTVKMSINSRDRYKQDFQIGRSKEKSFIITSRKAPSSNSKDHRDSFVYGTKQEKANSEAQIQKLSFRLKQMQEKLQMVQKKQKEIQETEIERKKVTPKEKSQAQSRVSSKINEAIVFKKVQKEEKSEINYEVTMRQKKEQKMKKLSISSQIVAYNYTQDLQKEKREVEKVNDKEKMSREIEELKKVIKQLKIDKIKQEAKIEDLEHRQNRKTNNFISDDNSQITFNGEDSKAESNFKESSLLKHLELAENQKEAMGQERKFENSKPYIKKEPRRVLKLNSNQKVRSSKVQSPVSSSSKNNTFSLNSSEIKKELNQISFNPEQSLKNQINTLKKKGIIIRQIINKEKFNSIDSKIQQQQRDQFPKNSIREKTESNSQLLEKKQNGPIDFSEFERAQVNVPQIEMLEGFPIPNLPSAPLVSSTQAQILTLAKGICDIFEIKINGKEQLQFKKFKNCVILKTPESNKAIVWHYSGKFYIGGWDQDQSSGQDHKHGEGFEFVPEKHYYRGQFKCGKRHGQGTMMMVDGDIYKGEWSNGQRHGLGTYYEKKTNACYKGQWKEGKKDGNGTYKISQKQFYQGQFDKSVKLGKGLQSFLNGDLYIGEYKNGKFHGQGKYYWSNGSVYVGNFSQGQREGSGKWISGLQEGDIYIGEYKKDKKEGKGKYVWAKGCTFEGSFKSDLKHGEGKVQYQDGREVKGLWQFGKLKTIYKSQMEIQASENSHYSMQIEPRIRPNMPRIIQTPTKQMQESKLIHGV